MSCVVRINFKSADISQKFRPSIPIVFYPLTLSYAFEPFH